MNTPSADLPANFDGSIDAIDRLTSEQGRRLRYIDLARPLFRVDHEAARRCVFLASLNDAAERNSYQQALASGKYPQLAALTRAFDAGLSEWDAFGRWDPRASRENGEWRGAWRGAWKVPAEPQSCATREIQPIPGPSDGVVELGGGGHLRRVRREDAR